MSGFDLPLPRIGGRSDDEDAFAQVLAAGLVQLHRVAGGKTDAEEQIEQAAKLVGAAILEGNTFVDLDSVTDGTRMRSAIAKSPLVGDGKKDESLKPLILSGNRLYLARYWDYERRFNELLGRLNRAASDVEPEKVRSLLDRYFKPVEGIDYQKVAAATAILRHLCVISGGPGTGKTTTIVKILAILLGLNPKLRIAIAAPTGKAAARVQESIRQQAESLKLPAAVAAAMPHESHTIHRLLGSSPGKIGFRHHRDNRLPYDVVVVDEASMLDLALAAKLVEALNDDARLIMLGDKDQLSSVEAGAVYAGVSSPRKISKAWAKQVSKIVNQAIDPVATGQSLLEDAVVWLERSYRFKADSSLGLLAKAVNENDRKLVLEVLQRNDPAVTWVKDLPKPEQLAVQLAEGFGPYVEAIRSGVSPKQVFAAFDRYRVLCSTRVGQYGSDRLGRLLRDQLRRHLHSSRDEEWFVGRAVLVTANDYAMRLFNGDVGIVLADTTGVPAVHFQTVDQQIRLLAPIRLGNVDDALAITVHRSQGSEFERVAVVLEPSLTKGLVAHRQPLLYTAITRAKSELRLLAQKQDLIGE